ncbi:MAG: phosphate ABC transporter ATP-binding protein [Thermoleophilia bacterium]
MSLPGGVGVTNGKAPGPAPAGPVMRAAHVTCSYGGTVAVRDVSLDVHRGEILALIGPSGCGKTTFLRSLNRLLDLVPSARVDGRITLEGVDIRSGCDPETPRRRVGYVFQLPNPFPTSIFDNVSLAMLEHGLARRSRDCRPVVEDVLRRVGLLDEVEGRLGDSALQLSGGQQQRLCIARLLAIGPEVVLLDEPCSALDPRSTAAIEDELRELRRELAVVIVTHNMQQARRIADRVGFFLDGELVELGDADQVFDRPRDARTADYLAGRFG